MITRLEFDNFKSLVNFDIHLPKFTCLVGLNGSGKSSILQAISFLAQMMSGNVRQWFQEREWEPKDIKSQLEQKKNTARFKVEMKFDPWSITWEGEFNYSTFRMPLAAQNGHIKFCSAQAAKARRKHPAARG
ncbi:MAG: AAA family ATPase [Candidatus Sumerlaeota bacterium]|nr:AAA family ATPase [Candidatus Sumerlaeota bacterium]